MTEITPAERHEANGTEAEPAPHDIQLATLSEPEEESPPITSDVQTRLYEQAQVYGPPAPPQLPLLSEERRAAINTYVEENAEARYGLGPFTVNDVGGTRVGEALTGQSDELGALTRAEQDYLATTAAASWASTNHQTNASEAADAVRDDPQAAAALARAFATPSADTARIHARDIPTIASPEWNAFQAHALDTAVALDPATAVDAFAGVEDRLAGTATYRMDIASRQGLLQTVVDGRVTGEAADRLVTGMFVHAERSDFETGVFTGEDETLRAPMAQALAMVAHPSPHPTAQAERALLAGRLETILSTEGGRDLLANEDVRPEQRLWALEQVTQNPDWTPDMLDKGWESDVVSSAFAEQTAVQFGARDPDGEVLRDAALSNMVGTALGQQPDNLPGPDETDADAAARLAQGTNYAYFSDESPTAEIARRIEAATQDDPEARISVIPVTVTSNEFGVAQIPVFRIDRSDGSTAFVDNEGGTYRDLDHWESKNELPQGRFVAADGLDLHNELSAPDNTRRVIDTWSERAGDIGDKVAMGVGIGAGVALATIAIVGSGGAATPFLLAGAAGAGGWTATRAGSELYDDYQRGHDILDWSDPDNRSRWLEVAAGTLSVGAISAGARTVSLGQQASQGLTRFAAVTALAADGVDLAAMGDQAIQMAANWDQMSNSDRAAGLLNMAFYGGMTVASTRAGGLDPRDMGSFQRMDNTFRTGTPYPMGQSPDLLPGQMRVAYDMTPTGLPTNVRIETGAGTADPDMLALHTSAARQIEQASGLQARLGDMLGLQRPEPGTAPWEAQIEIGKINTEARQVVRDLANPSLSPELRSQLEARQLELDRALVVQTERMAAIGTQGQGWIASPSQGSIDAAARGWSEAPDGHSWVGDSTGGEPVLFRDDGGLPVHEFDPIAGEFTDRYRRGETGALNPDLNPPRGNITAGLTPDARIEYDNGQVFETNSEGHVSRVEADLSIDGWVRDQTSQAAYGNIGTPAADYDGGHLLARMFGGSPDRINVVPQDSYLNRHGMWRQMEQDWEQMLRADMDVGVEIDVIYPAGGGPVPERFDVITFIDGERQPLRQIWNTRDGLPEGNIQ